VTETKVTLGSLLEKTPSWPAPSPIWAHRHHIWWRCAKAPRCR